METQLSEVISLTIYKLSCLTAGLICVYMGYRLFVKGIWGKAADIEANYENTGLVIKSAAPGTIFAIAGLFVICFTVVVGLEFPKEKEIIEVINNEQPIDNTTNVDVSLPDLPEVK